MPLILIEREWRPLCAWQLCGHKAPLPRQRQALQGKGLLCPREVTRGDPIPPAGGSWGFFCIYISSNSAGLGVCSALDFLYHMEMVNILLLASTETGRIVNP